MEERWKRLSEFKDYYISDLGNVKKAVKGGGFIPVHVYKQVKTSGQTVLKISINTKRYVQQLCVHRLVADAFCKGSGKYVFHKDGNAENNVYTNLYKSDNVPHEKTRRHRCSPVSQFSLAGIFVKRYPSITEAHRQSGVSLAGICECCSGKLKTSGGYRWEYIESDKQ